MEPHSINLAHELLASSCLAVISEQGSYLRRLSRQVEQHFLRSKSSCLSSSYKWIRIHSTCTLLGRVALNARLARTPACVSLICVEYYECSGLSNVKSYINFQDSIQTWKCLTWNSNWNCENLY